MSDQEKELLEEEEQPKGGIIQAMDKNSNLFLIIGIILLLLAGGIYYYFNIAMPKKEAKAASEMFMADRNFDDYITSNGADTVALEKALNGDDEFLGALDIADEYSGTKAGMRANYYIGRSLMNKGAFEDAISYLKNVNFDDVLITPQAKCLIGDCESELGNYEEAASQYMKAYNQSDNNFSAPYALTKAARVYEKLEKWEKAANAYRKIKKDYPNTSFGRGIDKFISRAEIAAKG